MRKSLLLLGCLLPVVLSAGCGSDMLRIKGRVVKGGQPFITGADEGLRIVFVPTVQRPDRYDAYVAYYDRANGSFEVVGSQGAGLPPGTYKVGLELMKKKSDQFHGAYSPVKSPITVEVKRSGDEVVVDLDTKG